MKSSIGQAVSSDESCDESSQLSDDDDILFLFEMMDLNKENIDDRFEALIAWRPGAETYLRAPYRGTSRATKFRKLALEREKDVEMLDHIKITSFFERDEPTAPTPPPRSILVKEALKALQLKQITSNNARNYKKLKKVTTFDAIRLLAVQRFLESIDRSPRSRVSSSQSIAAILFGVRGDSYRARSIRDWSDYYVDHHVLPSLRQGKHQKTKSLIDDEDIRAACLRFLRSKRNDSISKGMFSKVNNSLLLFLL